MDFLPVDIYARSITIAGIIVAALQALKSGLGQAGIRVKGRVAVALNLALALALMLVTAQPSNGSELYRAVLESVAAGGIFSMIHSLINGQPTDDFTSEPKPKS